MVMLTEPFRPSDINGVADPMKVSFDLLNSTPFSTTKNSDLLWTYPKQAARLMRCTMSALPQTQEDLTERLDMSAKRARKIALRSLKWDGACYRLEYQIDSADGRRLWLEERGHRVSETVSHCTLSDITKRKSDEAQAIYLNQHDPRTGLLNKAAFISCLNNAVDMLRVFDKEGLFLAVKCVNISNINKNYSYDIGDQILSSFAERLHDCVSSPDSVGVINGALFGVCLLGLDISKVEQIANDLKETLSKDTYPTSQGHVQLDIAIAAKVIKADSSAESAIKQTQSKLDVPPSKSKPYIFVDNDDSEMPSGAMQVVSETDILAALNSRCLSLAYQPIIRAADLSLYHYECLLRLEDDEGLIKPAGDFIMTAERLGLVHLLDRRALEIASDTLRRHPDINLALNVSAQTVMNTDTAQEYLEALRALGLASKRVTLELTETAALEDPAKAGQFAAIARSLGCKFAIDDFGAGHTSFQNLLAIEADSVKIDGSFIDDILLSDHKQTFIRMMVDLAQTFGVKTVAERVETQGQANLLKRLGVDYLQGYYFGMPSAAPAWNRPLI